MTKQKIKVLVIEDDPDDLEIIRICLVEPDSTGLAFEVTHADRLKAGLELLQARPFDVVLLDLMLPDSGGLDTLLAVLARDSEVPTIVMTNMGDETAALEAMRLGAQDYLLKSTFDSRWLKRAVCYAIERRKLLAQSENIIRKAPDGMLVIDVMGVVQYVNPAAEALFKLEGDVRPGQPFLRPAVAGETTLLRIAGPSGERTAEMRVTEIEWKGGPARLASVRDITELRKIESLRAEIKERRRLDQVKDDWIGTVSHELRSPLSVVSCAVMSLEQGAAEPLLPKQGKLMGIASRNLARLCRMIDNLLDLARLESGRAKAELVCLDFRPVVAEVLSSFELVAKKRGASLQKELPPELPFISADSDMLAEVLYNLLDNALRFAKTKVSLKAGTGKAPSGRRGLLIEVSDDGPGIPPDKMDALFSKFAQVQRIPDGAGYKGTGLGLAICKEILTLHGAELKVESAPGAGCRFSFVLPEFAPIGVPAPPASAPLP